VVNPIIAIAIAIVLIAIAWKVVKGVAKTVVLVAILALAVVFVLAGGVR
jgi:hypothetical protein